jgi:hypothetical protein
MGERKKESDKNWKNVNASDLIWSMGADEDRWKMVLHATTAEDEAQQFRRGMMDGCERMRRQGLYASEANTDDAGDLNWNVMVNVNCQMEWMRMELGVNRAVEVDKLRFGTAGDLNSTARLALGYRRDEQTAMEAG